jgi:colanic acid/amylovoran biosynthesis glycosyltransferase
MLSCSRSEWPKLHYVPLGIDPADFPPRPHSSDTSPIRLLCVGRLAPEKGQIFLLNAMVELCRTGPPLRLHLVGDGPDRAWLEREASAIGVAANIEFEGWVDGTRLKTLYAQTDVFVLPSLAEGIPMVLMEAMAMEIPCVATWVGGVADLIRPEIDGLLIPPADAGALTAAIERLREDPELRKRLGASGRQRVLEKQDLAKNTAALADVMRRRLRPNT